MSYHYYVGYIWPTAGGFATAAMEVIRDRPVSTFAEALALRDWIADHDRITSVTVLGISLLRVDTVPDSAGIQVDGAAGGLDRTIIRPPSSPSAPAPQVSVK